MRELKHIIYLCVAVGLFIFAVPQFQFENGYTLSSMFALVWLGMILLVIAAQLHQLFGVDEETKEELAKIKAYKRWKMEQFILRKLH